MTEDESVEMACDWADYRSDVGVPRDRAEMEYKAFVAGWKAARHGSDRSVLR